MRGEGTFAKNRGTLGCKGWSCWGVQEPCWGLLGGGVDGMEGRSSGEYVRGVMDGDGGQSGGEGTCARRRDIREEQGNLGM